MNTTLRYGYTLADLHNIAHLATRTAHTITGDYTDRWHEAFGAAAEHLYAAHQPPAHHDLVTAARNAILTNHNSHQRHHGQRFDGNGARYLMYWDTGPTPSPENPIVEQVAMAQILPTLAPKERAAIVALAAFGDYRQAAAAVGLSYKQFAGNLARGRRKYLTLWHEGEQPSRMWATDHRNGDPNRTAYRAMRRLRERTGTRRRTGSNARRTSLTEVER